ncbi:DUF1566 domain-containing protein [Bathymodiolus thermophilus thioautotrophic gill symbiont]|uniref:Lcl C-terminal domain-containing protein n=1 Tax=Bathymodiolus thermophilus thioautotrophic gill symbiont TaxID=2360 RepID=A0A8H9CF57_9GAMM|nr:DUF1566 domain-containing protein [Bathymodiolus thermophilus thioautotrophic gill symbiont]CAB5494844.1 hypothetical protein THERMOS_180 [Bathymodiolus thermophilus thioautotrophic gill symbiont]
MKKTILFLTINIIFLTTSYVLAQTCTNYTFDRWKDSRYTDNKDGTITDKQTNLMWKKCSEGLFFIISSNDCRSVVQAFTWKDALKTSKETINSTNNRNFAGHNDWRLPNIKELGSLVTNRCFNPSINETIFPSTPSNVFWSSSPGSGSRSWQVNFNSANDTSGHRIVVSSKGYVRLVRFVQ